MFWSPPRRSWERDQTANTEVVKEEIDNLKETMESVINLIVKRFGTLKQALPPAIRFSEIHEEIDKW